MGGDFNGFWYHHEKRRGRDNSDNEISGFHDVLDFFRLEDLCFLGNSLRGLIGAQEMKIFVSELIDVVQQIRGNSYFPTFKCSISTLIGQTTNLFFCVYALHSFFLVTGGGVSNVLRRSGNNTRNVLRL